MIFLSDEIKAELYSVGIKQKDSLQEKGNLYFAIHGRPNPRIWLIPCRSRLEQLAGLKLFEPPNISARIAKTIFRMLVNLRLMNFFLKPTIALSPSELLEKIFNHKNLSYAVFTGTKSPHRKSVIQVQTQCGRVLGYCKSSSQAAVKPLLQAEKKALESLNSMNLKTAVIPIVIHFIDREKSIVLITDSSKSQLRRSCRLSQAHFNFLLELRRKTAVHDPDASSYILAQLKDRLKNLQLTDVVLSNVLKANLLLAEDLCGKVSPSLCMCHGDFTPWNTFLTDGKLYVFDWEYAREKFIVGYDWLHYQIQTDIFIKKKNGQKIVGQILNRPKKFCMILNTDSIDAIFFSLITYLLDMIVCRLERCASIDTGNEYIHGIEGIAHRQMLQCLQVKTREMHRHETIWE